MGKDVLITDTSGGVGHFAVQLAKLQGACVSALVGCTRPDKALHDRGADEIMIYKYFFQSEQTYDLIIDSAGGDV